MIVPYDLLDIPAVNGHPELDLEMNEKFSLKNLILEKFGEEGLDRFMSSKPMISLDTYLGRSIGFSESVKVSRDNLQGIFRKGRINVGIAYQVHGKNIVDISAENVNVMCYDNYSGSFDLGLLFNLNPGGGEYQFLKLLFPLNIPQN